MTNYTGPTPQDNAVDLYVDVLIYRQIVDLYADEFIYRQIVNVYLESATYVVLLLPVYKSDYRAVDQGLAKNSLYFSLEGRINVIGPQTSLILKFNKAFSYIRRLF